MYIIHVVGGSVFDYTGFDGSKAINLTAHYHVPRHFEGHKMTKPKVRLKYVCVALVEKGSLKHVWISTHINGDQICDLELSQVLL